MRIGPAQVVVLRLGALMCLLAAVVLVVVAITLDSSGPTAEDLTVVEDPTAIELPELGLFGGQVVVYGAVPDAGVPPSKLGCRLLTAEGRDQNSAKMSDLRVITAATITLEDEELRALFSIERYTSGSVLACTDAASAAPLAVSEPSTFGTYGLLVRAVATMGAVACVVVALVGLLLARTGRRPSMAPGEEPER